MQGPRQEIRIMQSRENNDVNEKQKFSKISAKSTLTLRYAQFMHLEYIHRVESFHRGRCLRMQ